MSMTVDWTPWLSLTAEQQRDLVARYKQIIRQESERALQSNYARMNRALGGR
jgi:hypothetical protein